MDEHMYARVYVCMLDILHITTEKKTVIFFVGLYKHQEL